MDKSKYLIKSFILILSSFALPIYAHVGHIHTLTFNQGLLHPFTGFDHLVILMSVGILSATEKNKSKPYLSVLYLLAIAFMHGHMHGHIHGYEMGFSSSSLYLLGFILGNISVVLLGLFIGSVFKLSKYKSLRIFGISIASIGLLRQVA